MPNEHNEFDEEKMTTTTEATTPSRRPRPIRTTTTTLAPTTTSRIPAVVPSIDNGEGLHMIALNYPIRGYLKGISGADSSCYRQARRAGLKGTYRAFLSSRDQDVRSIVSRRSQEDYPILNINGDVLFNSWKEIFQYKGSSVDP